VKVLAIRALQPDEARVAQVLFLADRSKPGYFNRNEPVLFEVDFNVEGLGLAQLVSESAEYDVRLSAHSYRTHADVDIGTTAPTPLVAGRSIYFARLRASTLALDAGQFRLEVVVTIRNFGQTGGGCSAALMQVI
jgi:hypothetical protein